MITKAEVATLIKNELVKSVSLCKYLKKEVEPRCFVDVVFTDNKKEQYIIAEEIYDSCNVLESTGASITVGCKILK